MEPPQADMGYDTQKTFREIHSTVNEWRTDMQNIEGTARFRITKRPAQMPLRFLTPLMPQPSESGNVVHLRVTPLSDYNSTMEYVCVSYTWYQPEDLEFKYRKIIPVYKVWEGNDSPRAPRCSPQVLHRALTFAGKMLDTPLIWIDQECINQHDPVDVENHLQRMHEIYQKSRYTAVILSTMFRHHRFIDGLFPFRKQARSIFEYLTEEPPEYWHDALLAIRLLTNDLWFTRTWCFQERHCAGPCYFLIPVDPEAPFGYCFANSLWFSNAQLLDFHKHTEQLLDAGILEYITGGDETIPKLAELIKHHYDASKSNTQQTLSTLTEEEKPQFYLDCFQGMEACNNSVVADRIAIFGNVCRFPWALHSTRLRNPRYSYSTCILVLLRMNARGAGADLLKDDNLENIIDYNIGDILRMHAATLGGSGSVNALH